MTLKKFRIDENDDIEKVQKQHMRTSKTGKMYSAGKGNEKEQTKNHVKDKTNFKVGDDVGHSTGFMGQVVKIGTVKELGKYDSKLTKWAIQNSNWNNNTPITLVKKGKDLSIYDTGSLWKWGD